MIHNTTGKSSSANIFKVVYLKKVKQDHLPLDVVCTSLFLKCSNSRSHV